MNGRRLCALKDDRQNFLVECALNYYREKNGFEDDLDCNKLRVIVKKNCRKYGVDHYLPTSDKSVSHYIDVARIWHRLEKNHKKGIGDWTEEEIELMERTGIKFMNNSSFLSEACTTEQEFMEILTECLEIIKNPEFTRDEIDSFLRKKRKEHKSEEIEKPRRNMNQHNQLKSYAANFLEEMGCKKIFDEVNIGNGDRVDVCGVCVDGEIINVECKVNYYDFCWKNKRDKLKSYYMKSDAFYVFTFDKRIYNDIVKWNKEGLKMGCFLYSDKEALILESFNPEIEETREFVFYKKNKEKMVKNLLIKEFITQCNNMLENTDISIAELIRRTNRIVELLEDGGRIT